MKQHRFLFRVVIAAVVVVFVAWAMKRVVTSPAPTGYLLVTVGKGADEAPTVTAVLNKSKTPSEKTPSETTSAVVSFRTFEEQVARLEIHVAKVRSAVIHVTGPTLNKPQIKGIQLVDRKGKVLWNTAEGIGSLKIPHSIQMPRTPEWLWQPWQVGAALAFVCLLVVGLLWAPLATLLMWRPRPIAFIGTMAGGVMAAACLYDGAIELQREAPLPNESWVPDVMMEKMALIRHAASPRTILTGGSSGLYGIDAALMTREGGQECFNMAVHAAMPIEYYLDHVREIWAKGDTILLQLEFHYWQKQSVSSWRLDQELSWGSRGVSQKWLHVAPIDEVMHLAPDRVLGGLIAKAFPAAYHRKEPLRISMPWGGEDWQYGEIRFVSLDDHGDRIFTNVPMPLPAPARYIVDDHFDEKTGSIPSIGAFLAEARTKGIKVYIAFPATMESEFNNFHSPLLHQWVDDCLRWIDKHGAIALGRPEDMTLPRELFYGTNYHLNGEGRELHTRRLLDLLKQAGWPAH